MTAKYLRDPNCVFCKIVAGEIPSQKVFEDERFLAIKDIKPIAHGHTVVMSKNHYVNGEDMPDGESGDLFNLAKKLAPKVVTEVGVDGYVISAFSNEKAQSTVPHRYHLHIVPRKEGDQLYLDPRGRPPFEK